jgi:radical SAM superfamily enzyme YgiQ (UPF0313 family)
MKQALILTFDLVHHGEPATSLAAGSLLAFLRAQPEHDQFFTVEHHSIEMASGSPDIAVPQALKLLEKLGVNHFDTLALSCFVWSDTVTNRLLADVRAKGFRGKIVLGGGQISFADPSSLSDLYPDCDLFIRGYGEASLLQAILMEKPAEPRLLTERVDFDLLPSPYLSGAIPVNLDQAMVRLETKRGCPYHCAFCAHRDLSSERVHPFALHRIFREIAFLATRRVKRINIIDPVFNYGNDCLAILERFVETGCKSTLTLQTRLEHIRGKSGERFLGLVKQLGACLEVGVQSLQPDECTAIDRKQDPAMVRSGLRKLADLGIAHQVSLIYGLPNQTLASFQESVSFVREAGCTDITAFPLMLLRGTPLEAEKARWNLQETLEGEFQLPTVTASNSFSRADWEAMRALAATLQERISQPPTGKTTTTLL